MLLGTRTSGGRAATDVGRVRRVTCAGQGCLLTVDGAEGPHDVAVPCTPDPAGAAAAAAGFRRLQWVHLHLDGPAPHARLAGTTRQPHVCTVGVAAALALAERGVPAYVSGAGA